MFGKKKEQLPPGVKSIRLKLAFGFLLAVVAVTYIQNLFSQYQSGSLTPQKVESNVSNIKSLSTIHENTVANVMLNEMKTLAPNELCTNIGEQEKIEAILKAFHRLPGQELERLQIDLTQPVIAGTPEAEVLFEAWKQRQAELKDAMKNLLNAAEYMTNITRTLNGTALPSVRYAMIHNTPIDVSLDLASTSDANSPETVEAELSIEDKLYLLKQLESLLDDVDNARDFHTIGGWPTLLAHLHTSQPVQVRSIAALAVGTAIKNTYDYQLWTLESPASLSANDKAVNGLDLLIEALATAESLTEENAKESFELQKRALYALSAAMRGNMDVQDALLQMPYPSADGTTVEVKYVHYLYRLAISPLTSTDRKFPILPPELLRKVWSGAADLLEERAYIRRELAHEVSLIQAALTSQSKNQNNSDASVTNSDTSAMDAAVQQQVEVARKLQEAVLLGDHLINPEWMQAATAVALDYAATLNKVESERRAVTGVNGAQEPTLQNSEHVAMHATLRSILAFVKEALVDTPQLYETSNVIDTTSHWQVQLQLAVRTVLELVSNDQEGTYEALGQSAQALGALIGLLDQGANSAVF